MATTGHGGSPAWTARLLWAACHRHPPPQGVVEALEAGGNPGWAVEIAVRQRLPGLLWRALEVAGALDVLGDQRQALADLLEVQRLRELLVVPSVLERAVTPLVEAGFEPVVLKGPTVSSRYPGPGLRPFDDLDVLLPRRQHAPALQVLEKVGWRLLRPSARDLYDTVLVHPEVPEIPLELHYGLDAWYERASSLRAEELWQSRVPGKALGVPLFCLPLAEELVMLCAHAAKPYHGFSRLMWAVDLAMILGEAAERGEQIDWDRVASLARAGRCSTGVAVAFGLARFAGAESPPGLRALPQQGWRARALDRVVDENWPLVVGPPPIHLRFALAEGTGRRVLLLIGYTHGMPGITGLAWYAQSWGHAVRRWRDLRARR